MQHIQLTETQQQWLAHFNQSQNQQLSMSAYAKQKGLSLKAFYNARKVLLTKGAIECSTEDENLLPANIAGKPINNEHSICRITLMNGIIVETPATDITALLKMASQL